MALLRALRYFVEEAFISLWRSRLIHAVSIGTIAVSLLVLGTFLTVASNLHAAVAEWSRKIQIVLYLEDGLEGRIRESLERRLAGDPAVAGVEHVTQEEALRRFRRLFPDLQRLPEDLGENPFPASLEVTVRADQDALANVDRLVVEYTQAPGVEQVQYDSLWIRRLNTAIQLVRWIGGFLGGILVIASVFTISNVIRLTAYTRQDELDIMRLVGATRAYVQGPFVVEGVIQGGLGGLAGVGLLWLAFRMLVGRALASSDLLGRAVVFLPIQLAAAIVIGGMVVGIVGSLVSLRRMPV
ncbi:MAG: ABC transporter permease [Vicinamibacteria bacterium]|nr:ABC transporter permease [Vicinamibacteria bacterium]